jgi:hypothetical protein
MATLDETIHRLARKGEISHVTLAPTIRDGKTKWQASYRDVSSVGYRIAIENDPVEALDAVLNNKVRPAVQSKSTRNRREDLV